MQYSSWETLVGLITQSNCQWWFHLRHLLLSTPIPQLMSLSDCRLDDLVNLYFSCVWAECKIRTDWHAHGTYFTFSRIPAKLFSWVTFAGMTHASRGILYPSLSLQWSHNTRLLQAVTRSNVSYCLYFSIPGIKPSW